MMQFQHMQIRLLLMN